MKPLSIDLRERVRAVVDAGETYDAVAARFAVGLSTVGRLFRQRERTGSAAPRPHAGGLASVADAAAWAALRGLVVQQTDATLAGSADGEAFAMFVADALCPALRPGDVVVTDNLAAHGRPRVRELTEAAGTTVL